GDALVEHWRMRETFAFADPPSICPIGTGMNVDEFVRWNADAARLTLAGENHAGREVHLHDRIHHLCIWEADDAVVGRYGGNLLGSQLARKPCVGIFRGDAGHRLADVGDTLAMRIERPSM